MDKKLLDSLNNLSIALQDISDSLNSKSEASSATAKAMKGGNFTKEIKEINIGVKQLQKDSKQILSNQQTIIKMVKSNGKSSKTPMEEVGGDKKQESNLKKGVGTIILIAIAVLAIGMAFKLVGKIDFLSVIGLGIAIVVIAVAFEKIAKLNLSLKQAAIASLAMVMMSVAVMLSSWALGMIKPIGFAQAITGILIAGLFTVLAFGLPKIIKALQRVKDPVKMGFLVIIMLPALALGVTMASWFLSMIKPISFGQAITGILIAGMFTVLAFGLPKIVKALEKIKNPVKMAMLIPLMLPVMAVAITASSWVLQLIKPIGFAQAITAILIAALFVVLSFGIEKIVKALGRMKWADVAKMPVFFTLLSVAIAASAFIFAKAAPYFAEITFMMMLKVLILGVAMGVVLIVVSVAMKVMGNLKWGDVIKVPALFTLLSLAIAASAFIFFQSSEYINGISFTMMLKLLVFSIVLGVSITVLAIAMKVVNLLGSPMSYLKGGISVVIIAATIMLSSHILALGNYKKYPDWKWSLSVGLSLLAFIPAIIALGIISMTGVGALAILAGSGMVLLVAASIVATSHILAMGKYNKYPPLMWTLGTVAAMAPFALAMVALGIIAISGIGAIAMIAGAIAILGVAKTIVETSKILAKGKYAAGPPLSWSLGVGLVMTGFGMAILLLGSFIVGTLGFGWIALKAGSKAVSLVAQSIVDASIILQKGKYVGGPTKEWAEGIAIALGAFSPVYSMLMNSGILSIFGGKGVSPKDFARAIITVSGGIIDAAGFFAKNSAVFKNGPSKKWSEGVGLAIGAFAPVYKMLVDFPFSGGKKMSRAIITISKGIIDAAKIFAANKATFNEGYPSVKWGRGVGAALKAFAPVFKSLSQDTGWFTSGEEVINNMVNGIVKISKAIVRVGYIFSKSNLKWNSYPSKKWSWNVKNAIGSFIRLVKYVGDEDISYDGLVKNVSQMSRVAGILWKSKKFFKSNIDPSYIKNMTTNVKDFSKLVKYLSKDDKLSSGVLSAFGLDPASRAAQGMSKMAGAFDKLASSLNKFSSAIKSVDGQKVNMIRKLTGNIAILSSMDSKMFNNMMTVLERRSSVFSKLLDSPRGRGGLSVGEKPGGGQREVWAKKSNQGPTDSKGESALQKLDRIARILDSINKNVDTVDDLVTHLMTKKKEEKLGTKKD